MRAFCDIREKPSYRADAFVNGLKSCGFHVLHKQLPNDAPRPGDIAVIWNRYSVAEIAADKWEKQGGKVLVAENGYCGRDAQGHQLYALAAHGHNGSGTWPKGDGSRWASLGIEIEPWREKGDHILVCPNRPFGMKGLAMPQDWTATTVNRLRAYTKRPVRVRPHPGTSQPPCSLAADLENCHAVVIWASSAGVHSLLAGVPVICASPWWIAKGAAGTDVRTIEAPVMPERRPVFERLAWAQWSVAELASGEPFRRLLGLEQPVAVAA